jgi:uncharacterized protein YciW
MPRPEPSLDAYRPELAALTRRALTSLLETGPETGLTSAERLLVAAHAAAASGAADLAGRYTGPPGDSDVLDPARRQALLAHAERLTIAPDKVTDADLAALHAAGLSTQDVIALSQLVAYVAYEARVAAGLRALGEAR